MRLRATAPDTNVRAACELWRCDRNDALVLKIKMKRS